MRSKLDFPMENCAQHMDLSLGGGDSNTLILPAKRRNKRKGTNQDCEKLNQRKATMISKSQQRKLKKLEEEKEKSLSISKSIEALEKYKLPEGAHSLLQSSKNIGKVESKKEKRRKAVLFSKAGFGVPLTDQPFKKIDSESESESEPELEKTQSRSDLCKNDQVQSKIVPAAIQKNTFISLDGRGPGVNGGTAADSPYKNAISNKHDTSLREDINILPTSSVNDDSQSMKMEKVKETPNVNFSRTSKLSNSPTPRSLIAPTIVRLSRPEEVENARKDLPNSNGGAGDNGGC